MRTIKFRGRFWNKDGIDVAGCPYHEGEFVYGGYALLKNSVGNGDYIVDIHGMCYLVYPDSVAQLVGYDSNGAEIYEGDTLIDEKGLIYKAFLAPFIEWERGKDMKKFFGLRGVTLTFDGQLAKLTLKENQS